MSRIPLVAPDAMNPQERQQYDKFPANLTRGLVLADPRVSQALPNLANALRASSLDAKLREAAIVRVAVLHHSEYELMQHSEEVRKVGWSDAEVDAIKAGDWHKLPTDVAAVLQFVDEAVATGDVSDDSFSAVQAVLSSRHIATLILLVGHYMMVARFIRILRIEVDDRPDSWTHEH